MSWLLPAAMLFRAGLSIFGGAAESRQHRAEQDQSELNAFISGTRARQQDAFDRRSLSDELATMRNTFAANGQAPSVGTFEMYRELRDVRERERRINLSNRLMEQGDYQTAASNAGQNARLATVGGFARAGQSLFGVYDYYTR